MDCSLPGSSVHGILQARILQWVAMPSSRRSSQPRDWPQVSLIAGGFFTFWASRETHQARLYLTPLLLLLSPPWMFSADPCMLSASQGDLFWVCNLKQHHCSLFLICYLQAFHLVYFHHQVCIVQYGRFLPELAVEMWQLLLRNRIFNFT